MLTQNDMDSAALEAEATIQEWEQEFQAQFYAPGTQAAQVQAALQGNAPASDQVKRRADWLRRKIEQQPGGQNDGQI
jgi:hypothetical protein